jgi:hypothetical protein
LTSERAQDAEAQVLAVLNSLLGAPAGSGIAVKSITDAFNGEHSTEYGSPVTPKWIGSILRRKLRLATTKRHGVFVVPLTEAPRIKRLCERYRIVPAESPKTPSSDDLSFEPVDDGDMGDVRDVPEIAF